MKVYHIRKVGNESLEEGYIGISSDLEKRWDDHDRLAYINKTSPKRLYPVYHAMRKYETEKIVIFEGSEEECRKLEYELRPNPNMGWNLAVGGSHNGGCTWKGKKRPEHSEAMKKKGFQEGNNAGNVCIYAGGFIFPSIKKAMEVLKCDRKTIYNRCRNDKFKLYSADIE